MWSCDAKRPLSIASSYSKRWRDRTPGDALTGPGQVPRQKIIPAFAFLARREQSQDRHRQLRLFFQFLLGSALEILVSRSHDFQFVYMPTDRLRQ